MKKRTNSIVLLSSDDDDNSKCNRRISRSNSSNSKPKSSNAKSSNKKKARVSNPLSASAELFDTFDDLKFLSQDFAEGFSGFKSGTRRSNGAESWVDKYAPRSLDELCVHKKKVEEVKMWLEEKLRNPKQGMKSYVLLITGQAGVGKSAAVRVIASHFGVEICEWNTPTPTIWQEHLYNCRAGMRYISKLDEFENFVERVRKYGMLPSSFSGSIPAVMLLLEDLPLVNGKVAQGRLVRCLQLLVMSVQIPTVILITEYSGADSADASMRYWEELSSTLESAGASKVAFNPITVNSIKKTLSRISSEEKCDTSRDEIDLIANASGGDIRHAIMTLQYYCLRQGRKELVCSDTCTYGPGAEASDPVEKDGDLSSRLGRDQTLSLFHALGKFLHNKRETDSTMGCNEDLYLKEEFTRLPLKMDAPEKVLCLAYGQARPVAEFLHENVLDFIGQDAIEDACAVMSYMSDVDCLLTSSHGAFTRNYEAENTIQSAAASVAVRGVLFGNAHPSPARWHSIRRPMLWQVERSARRNMHETERQRLDLLKCLSLSDVSIFCTEYKPSLKWLQDRASSYFVHPDSDNSLMLDNELEGDELDTFHSLNRSSENFDDEIEDW